MNIHETILANKKKVKRAACSSFDDEAAFNFLKDKAVNVDLEKWEFVSEVEVDYEKEDELDKEIQLAASSYYLVLYKYSPQSYSFNSRMFCKRMITNSGAEYRKADILAMDSNVVNPGLGHKGASYSIWLYKGGVNCHHKWFRVTYKLKGDEDSPAGQISTSQARKEGFRDTPNASEVSVAPKDMPNNGHHPSYKPNKK